MRCLIAYFSGTGTTEIAVRMLGQELEKEGYTVDLARIEDATLGRARIDPRGYDLFGVASPVLEFGTPRIVMEFAALLPESDGQVTFILRTAGGVAEQNFNASRPLIAKLRRKGYQVFHERLISLGSNWIVKFSDRALRALHEAALRKTAIMARELREGKERVLKIGLARRLLMGTVSALGTRSSWIMGKDLRASDACTKCGVCSRLCPRGNITQSGGKPRFGSSCALCMRCVYSCPSKAIGFKLFSFFEVQGGYEAKRELERALAAEPTAEGELPPFLPAYVEDDAL
jgi:ferredoxin